jgi:hypothetical protein
MIYFKKGCRRYADAVLLLVCFIGVIHIWPANMLI